MASGAVSAQYGTTAHEPFCTLDLCGASNIAIGGWDYVSETLTQALVRNAVLNPAIIERIKVHADTVVALPAPRTSLDIPVEETHGQYWHATDSGESIERLRLDIETFRRIHGAEHIVVVFAGSPHRAGPQRLAEVPISSLRESRTRVPTDHVPSGLLYALAAIEAGASFVDFTPSETLEAEGLIEYARERAVQMAGRDGSTGQTMLKLALAQMLEWRRIHVDSWFSENLLGNHDGYILSLPEHAVTKLRDKRDALDFQVSGSQVDHEVRINYVKKWGDRKESWDAVECTGWLGNDISIRINWRAGDSLLAGPMILDLVRLLEHGSRTGRSGLQSQLGFFFKKPLGMERSSLAERQQLLWRSYAEPPL